MTLLLFVVIALILWAVWLILNLLLRWPRPNPSSAAISWGRTRPGRIALEPFEPDPESENGLRRSINLGHILRPVAGPPSYAHSGAPVKETPQEIAQREADLESYKHFKEVEKTMRLFDVDLDQAEEILRK